MHLNNHHLNMHLYLFVISLFTYVYSLLDFFRQTSHHYLRDNVLVLYFNYEIENFETLKLWLAFRWGLGHCLSSFLILTHLQNEVNPLLKPQCQHINSPY